MKVGLCYTFKINKRLECNSVIEHVFNVFMAMGSILSTLKRERKTERELNKIYMCKYCLWHKDILKANKLWI